MADVSLQSMLIGAAPFLLLILLRLVLDFRLAPVAVKYLHWLPVRNYFRERPPDIGGVWDHLWQSGGSETYPKDTDRHGQATMRQLGSYIYAEFYSKGVKYAFFGCIRSGYVFGDWFDVNDRLGYFGVFQLEIVNSKLLRGVWAGHSHLEKTIRADISEWTRIS